MQATLFGSFVFPPPATCAKLFAQADGTCARCTANAGEKLIVQRVVVNFVNGDVVPYITPCPVGQGIEFDLAFSGFVGAVNEGYFSTVTRLFAAQSCDPGTLTFEGLCQRF